MASTTLSTDEDAALSTLAAAQPAWAKTSAAERAQVAREVLAELGKDDWSVAGDWAAAEARLLELGSDALPQASSSRFVFGSLIKDFLTSIVAADEGKSLPRLSDAIDGSARHEVKMGMAAPGFNAELWAEEGVPAISPTPPMGGAPAAAAADDDAADPWRSALPCAAGTIALVLGAGNQSFLSLVEVLGRCLLHGDAVLMKHHPLRPWLAPPYAALLSPLARRGVFAQTLDEGVSRTKALLTDPRVGHVCITGSEATATAVRETLDGAARRGVGLSAELGCATPVLVAGGAWTEAELKNAAVTIAAAKKANGGCNCLSPQSVLLPRGWAHAAAFRAALVAALRAQPTQPCYYPGSRQRRAEFVKRYGGDAAAGGNGSGDEDTIKGGAACTVVGGAVRKGSAADDDEVALIELGAASERKSFDGEVLRREAFGAVLAVVEVGNDDGEGGVAAAAAEAADYLESVAVPFANSEACAGCLSCSVLVPASVDAAAVERAVAALNYGCVCVNGWSVLGYMAACKGATWGAHPNGGSRSGRGVAGNGYGVARPIKTVVRGPPLTTAPIIDGNKVPPPLLFDALHAALSAPSVPRALLRLWTLLAVRAVQGALVAARLLGWPRRLYGAAA